MTNSEGAVPYNRLCQTGGGRAGDRNQTVPGCGIDPKRFVRQFSSGDDGKADGT